MKSDCFLDTNVLIYAAGAKTDDPAKFAIATDLIASRNFCLSAQVLAEFYVVASKKYATALSFHEIEDWMRHLTAFPVAAVDAGLVRSAIAVSRRYRISYWDAALIAAAEQFEVKILYTEDLNHGQAYGSVTAINPFRAA